MYNPNDFAVDLSGYSLTDDLSDPRQWVMLPGTTISRRGHLLVWADSEPGQNAAGLGLHTNFRLSQDGDSLGLFAPDGTQVDALTFGPQEDDASDGRYPDGAPAPFVSMTTPTPGGPNVVPGPEAPEAVSVEVTDQGLVLEWAVHVGRTYQLEYKDDLDRASGSPLAPRPRRASLHWF